MHLRPTLTPAIATMAAACHLIHAAPPATNVYEAPPLVVTANRVGPAPATIPAQTTVITAERIRATGAGSVVDVLRDLGGLYVRTLNGNPAQSEVAMRGFGDNAHGRVLVLRDGQRLNSPDMAGINWLQIPLGAVQRIEIVTGGHSVLYGDHAVAGVINIVTRGEPTAARTEIVGEAGSYGAYGARSALSRTVGGTRLDASADWRTSDGFRHNGGYDAFGLRAAAEQMLAEELRLVTAATFDRYDNGLPGYLSREQMAADPRQTLTPWDSVETDNYNANAALQWRPDDGQRLDLNLIYNRKQVRSDMTSWFSFADTAIDSLTLTVLHGLETELFGLPDRLLGGVDFYFDRLDADRFAEQSRDTRLLDAGVDKQSVGAYLQNSIDLAERLTLSLGGRVEQARYTADVADPAGLSLVDDSKSETVSALSASLLHRPSDDIKLYARAASIYRLPFIDEQVSYYGYGSDRFYTALEPERGVEGEIGAALRLAREWQAETALFLQEMRDEIAYNGLTEENANLDCVRRQGIEAALGWERPGVAAASVRYDLTDAEFRRGPNDGRRVPLVPRQRVTLNARGDLPCDLALLATLHAVGNQVLGGDFANERERLSSYMTLDLALRYTPARLKDFSLLVGLDNVFDEDYANVAYVGTAGTGYYPAPGRTWKTALTCAF